MAPKSQKKNEGMVWTGHGERLHRCLLADYVKTFTALMRVRQRLKQEAIAVIADRTACSILTLFIVIATSRPLNKKNLFPVSPHIQQLVRMCVRRPHTFAALTCTARAAWVCHCWPTSRALSTRMPRVAWVHTYAVSHFVVHFVAKRYILQ